MSTAPPFFDPRTIGCRCDECFLGRLKRVSGTFAPVPPEQTRDTTWAIIAESPDNTAVRRGRPLIGPSGQELGRVLKLAGLSRDQFVLDNALLCQPPLNSIKRINYQWKTHRNQVKAENVRREARGERTLPLPPSPAECCRPHLLRRVRQSPNLMLLGAVSYDAVTGEKRGIRKIRGAFIDRWLVDEDNGRSFVFRPKDGLGANDEDYKGPRNSTHMRIVPSLHPMFVLHARDWGVALEQDVGRFKRWMEGNLNWRKPWLETAPSYERLKSFLYSPLEPFHAIDVETDGKDSLTANMRCMCFSTEDGGMVVPFRSVRPVKKKGPFRTLTPEGGGPSYYSPEEGRAIYDLIARWLLDRNRVKIGHNSRYFDAAVLCRYFNLPLAPQNHLDTIILFRANHSELKRDLYTLGTLYTDVPDWKTGGDDKSVSTDPRTDEDLWAYNNTDGVVTARCFPALLKGAAARGQMKAVKIDFGVQEVARGMNRLGLYVYEEKRRDLEETLTADRAMYRKQIQDLLGTRKLNPNSFPQVAKLLYDDWRLPILGRSEDTGEPATDDATLRALIQAKVMTDDQEQVALLLRKLRRVSKELSTYVIKLRPWNDYRINEEGKLVGGLTQRDGRVHPSYNVHTPGTGRISSSGPNSQNFPKHLRKMIIPAPGHAFVGADYDQIELRLVCAIAQVESYLKTFREGGDPHAVTAKLIYGDVFEAELIKSLSPEQIALYRRTGAPPKADDHRATSMYNALRRFAKTFVYAVLYGGTAQTIFDSVSAAEDNDGNLLFPDMTITEVRAAYHSWMKNAPEIPKWWEETENFAKLHLHITEPISGRRRDFLTFERNEVLNMPVQGGAAIIMAQGLIRFVERVPFNAYGPYTGVVNQCHDAETTEIPDTDYHIKLVREITEEALYSEFDHLPGVGFSAGANTAYSWDKAA